MFLFCVWYNALKGDAKSRREAHDAEAEKRDIFAEFWAKKQRESTDGKVFGKNSNNCEELVSAKTKHEDEKNEKKRKKHKKHKKEKKKHKKSKKKKKKKDRWKGWSTLY